MKICHVITRLIVGGAQENTVLTCRGLVEKGHDVILAAGTETGPEGSLWDQAETTGARLVRLRAMRRAVSPVGDWRARAELAALFTRTRPDVVHTHSSKAGIIGRSAAAAAGVPCIVHTIHGMSFNRTQPRWIRAAYRALERRAGRYTTAFVTVADAMIEQASTAGIAPHERFVTIRSGMETDGFHADADARERMRKAWGVGPDAVVVGTIARLFDNKGYDEIIMALPAIVRDAPQTRFVWVGDGRRREVYRQRLTEMGLADRVVFTGLVPPGRIAEIVCGFDILVHASRWEGLPRALVQALLCEVPCVSFDIDGAREVVATNETGVLVPFADVGALAQAVAGLAGRPDLRRRLGAQGRRRCLTEFDWRRMVDQLDRLYARLMNDRP